MLNFKLQTSVLSSLDFAHRLGFEFDKDQIGLFRRQCKNIALVLVLVKCYDNKMVNAAPHLFYSFVDSALGS